MILLFALCFTLGTSEASESFNGAPVPVWTRTLPGGPSGAANHAERSRPVATLDGLLLGVDAGPGLYLLSQKDGRVLQHYKSQASVQGSAVLLKDGVIFSDVSGRTYLYTHEGERVWTHESGSPILSTPKVAYDRVYFTNVDDLTVALNVDAGTLSWQYQRPSDAARTADLALFGAPTPVFADGQLVTGYSDGYLVGLHPETGALLWDVKVGQGRYPDIVSTPTTAESDVFATGYFGPLVAIDSKTQNVRWSFDAGSADAALLTENASGSVLIHPGSDGTLRCVSVLTGGVLWSWESGKNGALTRPVSTPAGILVGATDGGLSLIDLDTGAEKWSASYGFLLEGITAAPLVVGRDVYFTTNAGNLYKMRVPLDDQRNVKVTSEGWTRILR